MNRKYLTIIEVSQKQAYIFGCKMLKDNVTRSEMINYVTGADVGNENLYETLGRKYGVYTAENMVYSGGGHTILEFSSKEQADDFAKRLSYEVHCNHDYEGIELFIKTLEYDYGKTPSENEERIIKSLEEKKAIRRNVFSRKEIGIENRQSEADSSMNSDIYSSIQKKISGEFHEYRMPVKFEDLGGTKNDINSIAVVHIDGNSMGAMIMEQKRLFDKELPAEADAECKWQNYKAKIRKLSEGIADDFKAAFEQMCETVINNISDGVLDALSLKEKVLPLRSIIMSGDDICFVSEGRIGIEAASIFLEKLSDLKDEKGNNKSYSACAGVAIVHQKYPFYKAYNLAEELCDNAKKFNAELKKKKDKSSDARINLSSIDWQYQFGEMAQSLSEEREKMTAGDGSHIELRPYIVCGAVEDMQYEKIRRYDKFKSLYEDINDGHKSFARGKWKELRNSIRAGEAASSRYILFNNMEMVTLEPLHSIFMDTDFAKRWKEKLELERTIFLNVSEKAGGEVQKPDKHCIVYDAIESLDRYCILNH